MAPKEGTTGIEPVTIGSAIQCSTAELCTQQAMPTAPGSTPQAPVKASKQSKPSWTKGSKQDLLLQKNHLPMRAEAHTDRQRQVK